MVPQLVHGDTVIVGYDQEAIAALIKTHRDESPDVVANGGSQGGSSRQGSSTRRAVPPGNSLDVDQQRRVADTGESLPAGLSALLERIRAELDWNDARGAEPYRLGMHDGLRFAEDAVMALLRNHGHEVPARAGP